jgi:hypothetical protein
MGWFTKVETKNIETTAQPSLEQQYEQNRTELRAFGQQLAAAERAIMEHCRIHKDPRVGFLFCGGNWSVRTRINAMFMGPTLQKLHSNHAALLRERSAKLAEHARLKQQIGLGNF